MNKVFDFQRFGRYFTYDLYRAYTNYGLSVIVLGVLPIIIYFMYIFFSFVGTQFSGMPGFMDFSYAGTLSLIIAALVLVITAPSKLYGNITDKKFGTQFRLLPASVFEKWLSMIAITVFVVPAVAFGLILLSDSLLGVLFSSHYHHTILSGDFPRKLGEEFATEGLQIRAHGIILLSWISEVLVFTLGAVVFKKGKPAKTILCLMIISFVIASLLASFAGSDVFDDFASALAPDVTIPKVVTMLNIIVNAWYALVLILVGGGLYYRLRTISY